MNNVIYEAQQKIAYWRDHPIEFVREELKAEPDEWQKEFLNAYATGNRVAAKACKGPGKTSVLAWCNWHFLATRPFPKMAAVSITGDNLRDNLWAELAKWQRQSEFLTRAFTWRAERIIANDHPEDWFLAARSWSQSADKEKQGMALAGLHADHIMFTLDESGGIPDAVMATAEAALANAGSELNPDAEAKLLQAGNPTHLSGPLYRACTSEASLWDVIEITGDPDSPRRSKRISIKWAREQIQKYGADNPWVLINVFGKFPPSSLNALVGPDDMQAAYKRIIPPEAFEGFAKILGVDVARQGDDSSVIAPRQGLVCFKPKILRVPDTVLVAGQVAQSYRKWDADAINVDATGGWGYGVIDQLRNWGYPVNEVQFAGKALDRQYFNKRTEMAFEFAKWIKNGGCLPEIPELTQEATATTYTFKKDQMALIEKDQIKEEIGRSPDIWDAYSCTFAFPIAPRDRSTETTRFARADHNPMSDSNYHGKQSVDDYNPLS